MNNERITILAEINSYSGYGHHFTHIFHGLQRRGFFVSVRPIRVSQPFGNATIAPAVQQAIVWREQSEEWELVIAPPFHTPTPGKKTIYWTMWESTELQPESVRLLNLADVIIVPSFWCADVFESSGVTKPIAVVSLGVDPAVFHPIRAPYRPNFVFGAAGRIMHGGVRKGVNEVIPVFCEAFQDEKVELRVKVHPDDPLDVTDDPRVKITREHLTDEAVAKWLSEIDCFVSGATGEGFGLWQLQAMAIGRPVIAPIYGGLREFMTPENSFPVLYEEAKAESMWPGKWAKPDWVSMITAMRYARAHFSTTFAKGVQAAKIAGQFTWNDAVNRLLGVMATVGAVGDQHLFTGVPIARSKHHDFTPTYPPPVLDQIRKAGWHGGWIRFPEDESGFVHYNPAIVKAPEDLIFVRRATVNPNGDRVDSKIVAYDVEEGWNAVNPRVIDLKEPAEDPRAFVCQDKIILSYTGTGSGEPKQMLARLTMDLKVESMVKPNFGRNNGKGVEKNWVWFYDSTEDTARFIYQMWPHTVIVKHGWKFITPGFPWQWGEPRGGTPPIKVGNEYIRFFHSTLSWKNDRRRYYWVGAYAFQAREPYRVTRVVRKPLLAGHPNDEAKMIIPHAVVYPTGATFNGEDWTLLIGHNDEDCLWMNIPHKWLHDQLQAP